MLYEAEILFAVFFVEDVTRSKAFYVDLLGLEVSMDHGAHVSLAAQRFSLWQRKLAEEVIFGNALANPAGERQRFELYFEAEDIEATIDSAIKQVEK